MGEYREYEYSFSLSKTLEARKEEQQNRQEELGNATKKIEGKIQVIPVTRLGKTSSSSMNINSDKGIVFVDSKSGISRNYYYKVSDLVNLLLEIVQKCNTEIFQGHEVRNNEEKLNEIFKPVLEGNRIFRSPNSQYITVQDVERIINSLTGSEILFTKGCIYKFGTEKKDNGDIKITLYIKEPKRKKQQSEISSSTINKNVQPPEYSQITTQPVIPNVHPQENLAMNSTNNILGKKIPTEEDIRLAENEYIGEPVSTVEIVYHNIRRIVKNKIKENSKKAIKLAKTTTLYALAILVILIKRAKKLKNNLQNQQQKVGGRHL